jgi:hypothetical protein
VLEADEAQTPKKVRRGRWGCGRCTAGSRDGSLTPNRADERWPTWGLLGDVTRKNGWQLAGHAGERTSAGRTP